MGSSSSALAATADGPAGKFAKTQTGLTVSRPGVLVTAFGQNPDGAGTLLRVWDQTGEAGKLVVTSRRLHHCDAGQFARRKNGEPVNVRRGKIVLDLKAYAPASFILKQ